MGYSIDVTTDKTVASRLRVVRVENSPWIEFHLEDGQSFSIHIDEISKIPEVKALISATKQAKILLDDQLEILLGCIPDAKTEQENDVRKNLYDALDAFKE